MFDLQLFGPMQVRGKRLALSSSAKLLAQLALRPDRVWSRAELGNSVWPDADETSTRNRIRTALTEIRRALPDPEALSGDKHTLSLASANLTCDLWHAQTLQKQVRLATDPESELALHRCLVELLAPGFLPEFADGWVVSERAHWTTVLGKSCVRIVELESDPADSIGALNKWIELDPFNERAWELYLVTAARVGRGAAVVAEFDVMRSRLRAEIKGRPSKGLLELADSVRKNRILREGLSPSAAELVRITFERMLTSKPSEAAAFLGSVSFRPEVFRDPAGSQELLLQVLEKGEGDISDLMNCRVGVMISSGLQFDHDLTIRIAGELLEADDDPVRRRGAFSCLSFAYSHKSDWIQSLHYANESLRIAKQIGEAAGIAIAKAQVGNLCLAQMKTSEAICYYRNMLEILEQHNTLSANNGRASGLCNLGNALFYDGQIQAGIETLREGLRACEETNQHLVRDPNWAQYGMMLIVQGSEVSRGVEIFIEGIALVMRTNSPHYITNCIQTIAFVLSHLGEYEYALAALDHETKLRIKFGNVPTPLEEHQQEIVRQKCVGHSPDPEWAALSSPQKVSRQAIRLLQSRLKSN